ncbi:CBS domain-containing protein [Candidatus Comchoanobacter bicostacola]|uniref:CBS domain-containing protein n=1 Tax=Candidatus Comchoanobacter bicostacola TaxID=2919598 RepID=A0ABY5DHL6_9GAMM|nr:transporter associated domain-containing protein [Candidatus Comchoanobacter bicostacola]UTC24211.1 CBS domain-containing protein [Candidatus Comchoanobacter bicostacola]
MKIFKQLFTNPSKSIESFKQTAHDLTQKNQLDSLTHQLIINLIDSSQITIKDIMMDKSNVVTINDHASIKDLLDLFEIHKHSRYPVMNSSGSVCGIILMKDVHNILLQESQKHKVKDYLRPTIFTPATQRIPSLLLQLQQSRKHMAIVLDEYNQYIGVITIENLIESFVGAIEDEHDQPDETHIRPLRGGVYQTQGSITIETINQYFNCEIDTTMFDTLSGILTHQFGHIPKAGEKIQIQDLQFTIKQSDSKVIQLIEIKLLKNQ